MSSIKYTREHEWLRAEADGDLTIGITDYAQNQLGDIVYVELPAIGVHIDAHENLVVIESVKAVGEVKSPVAATVRAVNSRLDDEPELLNREPFGAGWLLRVKPDTDQVQSGMDEAAYRSYIDSL